MQAAAVVHRPVKWEVFIIDVLPSHHYWTLWWQSVSLLCIFSSFSIYLLYLPACYTVSFVIYTLAHLTQRLISIPNLLGERENEFRRSIVSLHGCVYQYLFIDLALPLVLHSSRYRLVFPAGIWAYNLTDGRSAWGRVYRTRVSHMPLECVRPLSKGDRGRGTTTFNVRCCAEALLSVY